MAKLTFHLPNGEQLAFRLFTDRRLRIGRERGNDIVLRDARISRTHAEVSFERGFFVVRDLGSSNGTFVNGREVKVAPLTEGAEVRIGSSVGRFSEELSDAPPSGPSGGRTHPEDEHAREPVSDAPPLDSYDDQPGNTRKHPKVEDPKWDYHRDGDAMSEHPTDEMPDSDHQHPRSTDQGSSTDPEQPVLWTVERSDTGRSILTGENDRRIYFDAPWNPVGLLSSLTAIAMLIAGFGASIAFVGRGSFGAAALAVVLTMIFVFTVMQLVPRQDIDLYEDESMNRLWVALRQETRGSYPVLRYSAREADGNPFAYLRKSFWTNIGRRRWEVRDRDDLRVLAEAREESSARTWLRKLVGSVSSGLVTDFVIRSGDDLVGRITRNAGAIYRSVVDVRPPRSLDPRSFAALGVLLEVVERK